MRVSFSVRLIRSACAVGLLLLSRAAALGQTPIQPAPIEDVPSKPPTLREITIPDAFAGIPFHVSVQAANGAADVVMNLRGHLPEGLTFQSGARTLAVSGIPQEAGTFDLEITATDRYGLTAHGLFTLLVRPHPLGNPPNAVITDAETVHTTDTDHVFFPVVIADSETIHLTDTHDVFMPAVIKVTEGITVTDTLKVFFPSMTSDAEVIHITDAYTVTVKLGVTPTTIPTGTVNAAYPFTTFSAAGNTGTVTYSESGAAPTGMTWATSGSKPVLYGTPTQGGSFPFTITVTDSINTSVVPYKLVINPASQTITQGTLPSPVYGGAAFNVPASASSGLPVTVVSTSALATGTGPFNPVGAGLATFQATQAGNANYAAATPLTIGVTIAQAPLTVTAANASRVFDQPNPTFAYSLSGLVNGDNSSVVSGSPAFSTTATPISSASSSYTIAIAQGSLVAANYTFSFTAGTLSIAPATQTITFYPLPPIVHGSAAFPLTARTSSGLPVTYAVTGPATITNNQLLVTGTTLVTVTASQAGNANYSAATSVSRSFTPQ